MEKVQFDEQIKRLESQWPNAYRAERIKILWNSFKDVAYFDFKDAITWCLGNSKSAPLVLDLEKAVQIAKNNYYSSKRFEEANAMGALEYAANNNKTADPEFVDRCLKLLNDLHQKKITKKQFDEGCDLLDSAAKIYKKIPAPKKIYNPSFDEEKPVW